MKDRVSTFFRSRVRPEARQVKKDGTRWFLRHSVIFATLYERQERKKGRFFGMKAKLTQFYLNKVEPKIKAARAKITRFRQGLAGWIVTVTTKANQAKQQVAGWLARRRRGLRTAALVLVAVAATAGLAYLWQRSPAFRAIVRTLGLAALTFWALLKGLGLSLTEGLTALGRSLSWLAANALRYLAEVWSRSTGPLVRIVVVTGRTEEGVPADGRLS